MKTTNKNIWLLAAAATLLLAACTATDDSEWSGEPDPVNFTASTTSAFSGTIGTRVDLGNLDGGNDASTVSSYNYEDIYWNHGDSIFVWSPKAVSNPTSKIYPYCTYAVHFNDKYYNVSSTNFRIA